MVAIKAGVGVGWMISDDEAERIREVARFHHDCYAQDQIEMGALAKAQGIEIIGIHMPECMEFRGIAVELHNGHQYIVLNAAHPKEIQQYYLAHELWHLVADDPPGRDFEREMAADLYAMTLTKLMSQSADVAPVAVRECQAS